MVSLLKYVGQDLYFSPFSKERRLGPHVTQSNFDCYSVFIIATVYKLSHHKNVEN